MAEKSEVEHGLGLALPWDAVSGVVCPSYPVSCRGVQRERVFCCRVPSCGARLCGCWVGPGLFRLCDASLDRLGNGMTFA